MIIQCATNMDFLQVNAALLLLSGVITLILTISLYRSMQTFQASRSFFQLMLATTIALFLYAICFLYHPHPHTILYIVIITVARFFYYRATYLYLRYIIANLQMRKKKPVRSAISVLLPFVFMISMALQTLAFFFPAFFVPSGAAAYAYPLFWVSHLGEWVFLLSTIVILIRYRQYLGDQKILLLLSVPTLLFIATIAEPVVGGLAIRALAQIIGVLIVYALHHFTVEQAERTSEAVEIKDRMMLVSGRLKPHYVYNVMTNIHFLCDMDTERAQNALATFSEYLRDDLNVIESGKTIPFRQELNMIENYVALEKMRFGDRLRVVYDLDLEDFAIPPLTVEPLVENAIKHGIMHLEQPGTVRLETRRLAGNKVRIRVVDNGVGFDTAKMKEQDEAFRELNGIKKRIMMEPDGDMTVESKPGEGTTVTITLHITNQPS